ncbi:MAG: hypothetical protein COV75_05875 [Candidatus Omnitrophica bacterium CG11_big_fil_rev_8_21_14_0_20_63_9]|nr:MAG: hypothetical protein COV75_05875 [Candidatus Omnitrophica bacterium CG11_big_fil_rev_8_21_14_0_20_63_9]
MKEAGGFTLIEMMLGAAILSIVAVALLGSFFGQTFLNQNARNLTAAMTDATRIMEQIRQQNTTAACVGGIPSARPPAGFASWNAWLNAAAPAGGGPKSVQVPTPNQFELVTVTCQDEDGGTVASDYCGSGGNAQIGAGEWSLGGRGQRSAVTTFNPIRVTVSIGWLQEQRVMGSGSGGAEFVAASSCAGKGCTQSFSIAGDTNNNGVIDSQAMLTTLVTCR